jgi:molybdenum cofactor cytidylyltransferase
MAFDSINISIILLAAGQSLRLGTPKQLLQYKGKTLMRQTLDTVKPLQLDIFCVFGAFVDEIVSQVDVSGTNVIINHDWEEGLSSSIRCGLSEVLKTRPETEAIILVLCDQPFLTTHILRQMVEKYHDSGKPIIHCSYGVASGPPTLFHKSLFPYLMALNGSQGAKKVVDMFPNQVVYVDFPEGKFDIDTAADYHQLQLTESNT